MRRNVYKVIKIKSRTSSALTPKNKYSLKYLKSFEVKAMTGTLGIFCFTRKKDAENFIGFHKDTRMIVRVFPIGKALKPKTIASSRTITDLNKFYKGLQDKYTVRDSIKGTVCYPSVLVLE